MNKSKRWVIGISFILAVTAMAESKKKNSVVKKETANEQKTVPVCKVSITDPLDGSEVSHNGKLWTHFTFTVKGIVENLGVKNFVYTRRRV